MADKKPARRVLGILLVGATYLALTLTGITWGLPGEHSWSNDDIAPDVALKAVEVFARGTHKYPNLQLLADRALYEPYLVWARSQGVLDPRCVTVDRGCFQEAPLHLGRLILISRLRSVVMGLAIVAVVAALAAMLFGPAAAPWAALLAATNETLGFYGKQGNLDVPHTLWFLLSVLAYVRILRGDGRRAWLTFGLFAGAALATKEGIVGAYVLMAAALLWTLARQIVRRQPGEAAWREAVARLGVMGAGLAGVYLLAQNALFNWKGFVSHLNYWLEGPGLKDGERYQGALWFAGVLARRAVEGAGWPQLIFCIAAMALALTAATPSRAATATSEGPSLRRAALWLLIPVVSYLLFTILPIRYVYSRYLLPVYLLAAVAGGHLAAELWRGRLGDRLRMPSVLGRGLTLAVLAYSAAFSLNNGLAMRRDTRLAAEAWLAASLPVGSQVLAFGGDSYLPRIEQLDLDSETLSWKDVRPYRARAADPSVETTILAEQSPAASAVEAMIGLADAPDLRPPAGAPDWLIVASRGDPPAGTPGFRLLERLRAGEAGYAIVWQSDLAFPGVARDGDRPSPWGRWLPGAVVESRVSPGIWVLRRRSGVPNDS